MRGTKITLGAVFSVAVGSGSPPADAILLEVTPSATSLVVGESLEVSVRISGLGSLAPPALGAFDINLFFDPVAFAVSGVVFGDVLLGDQLDVLGLGGIAVVTPSVGTVNLFELSLDSPTDLDSLQAASFNLATVSLDSRAPGFSPLTLGVSALGDALGDPLATEIVNASVAVTPADTAVPEPSALFVFLVGLTPIVIASRTIGKRLPPGNARDS